MHATLAPDVFPEHEQFRIDLQLAPQRTSQRVRKAHHFAVAVRLRGSSQLCSLGARQSAKGFRRVWLLIDKAPYLVRIAEPASARLSQTLVDVVLHLLLKLSPLSAREHARHELPLELRQRIASKVRGDLLFRPVASLIVGAGVAAEPWYRKVDEGRAIPGAHMVHAFLEQARRGRGVCSVAIVDQQLAKRPDDRGDVATRSLHITAHGDAEPIVL